MTRQRASTGPFALAALTALTVAAILAPASSARAEYLTGDRSASRDPQPEVWSYANDPASHDQGALVRGTFGFAWSLTRARSVDGFGPAEVSLEGPALTLSLAVGGIIGKDVAIHGTATAIATARPNLMIDGQVGESALLGALLVGLGPGVTTYLPGNAFVSTSVGPAILRIDFDSPGIADPDAGVGFFWELLVGKEWWVSARWGLGVAGHLTAHRVTTDGPRPFGGVSLGIDLSATFN